MPDANLGESMRRLREEQQLSLRALAERTGFSASFLSQVENGQASPSLASMERIAAALGVTLSQFFQTAEGNASPAVVRVAQRVRLDSKWSRARIEALAADRPGARLDPILVTLEPGSTSGTRAFTSPREEFALLLEGSAVLTLETTEQLLECGDSVVIRAGVARRWRNDTLSPTKIIIVSAR
ncbi:MAG: helix-turn-helix domain-containing protein [Gemmatimonadales bacterium]|nr:helix-turn-helix domain-containing protein [Gemmatimonadales bacterium]